MRRRTYSRATERSWDDAALVREGREAYGAGVPLTGNPYPDGGGLAFSGRYAAWTRGWRAAEWAVQRADYEAKWAGWRRGEG